MEPVCAMGRVIVVKNDRLLRDEIVRAVAAAGVATSDLVTCQTAGAAITALQERPAALGIFGLSLSDLDGLDLIQRARERNWVWRVLVVSTRHDERARQLIRPGRVEGFVNAETEDFAALVRAIRLVAEGRMYFSRDLLAEEAVLKSAGPTLPQMLTARQQTVLAALADGCSDRQGAQRLKLSAHTVHGYLQRLMHKLGVTTRQALVMENIRRGVLRVTPERVLHPGSESEIAAAQGGGHAG
jgi:DNA-binding NarL/FixJ family response regulator